MKGNQNLLIIINTTERDKEISWQRYTNDYNYETRTARIVHMRICWGRPWPASRQLCLSVRGQTGPSGMGRMDPRLVTRIYRYKSQILEDSSYRLKKTEAIVSYIVRLYFTISLHNLKAHN